MTSLHQAGRILGSHFGGRADRAKAVLEQLVKRQAALKTETKDPGVPQLDGFVSAPAPELFDYQEELFLKARGVLGLPGARALVALPTGGGKTRIAASLVSEHLREHGGKVVWIAPTRELLAQAAAAIRTAWGRRGIGQLRLTSAPVGEDDLPTVWLTTAQFVALNAARIRERSASREPSLIVFDEAHQAVAPQFMAGLLALAGAGKRNPAGILGLSATPGRTVASETDHLSELFRNNLVFSEVLGRDPIRNLRERGVLAELRFKTLSQDRPNEAHVTALRPIDPERFWATVDFISTHVERPNKALVFSQNVDHAWALAAALISDGRRAIVVSGAMSAVERERNLSWFKNGKVDFLINRDVLTAGYDFPKLEVVALTARVSSPIRYEQILGRVMRGPAVGGSVAGMVLQLEEHRQMHGEPESLKRYWDALWRPI